jgi:hypothetical protein
MLLPLAVQCPFCFEELTLWLSPDDLGEMVTDCEVCCRPWRLQVWLDEHGDLRSVVDRGGA